MENLKNIDIIHQYTDDLLHDGGKAPDVYKNSRYAKELLQRGRNVISEVGKYLLKDILPSLKTNRFEKIEKETVAHGWVILLCSIKDRHNIEIGRVVFGANLELWAKWAAEYSIPENNSS